jgi:3-hydroxyisobutyrate dehydrogenase
MLDAPVSGGAEGAAKGALSFMVGGPEAAMTRARPLLEAMGTKITHFGASGSGQVAKACHNMICGITALGVCEAFALAEALGLDPGEFFQLCKGAAAQSWILENRCPAPGPAPAAPSSNGYAPGFAARLMAKDLRLAQAAAAAAGQPTPFGAEAARRFTEFAETEGNLDFSAIYRTIRK